MKNTVVYGIITLLHVYAAIPLGVGLHGSCCGLYQRGGTSSAKEGFLIFLADTNSIIQNFISLNDFAFIVLGHLYNMSERLFFFFFF